MDWPVEELVQQRKVNGTLSHYLSAIFTFFFSQTDWSFVEYKKIVAVLSNDHYNVS